MILLVLCLITGISSKAADDSSLIFKAGFDNISVRAEKAAGWDGSRNFVPDTLQLRMHEGVAGKGNALTLNNRESVVYSNYKNHNPRQGTISLWIAPKNWSPDKKKFQIFFDSAFPGGCRFLIYKFIQNSLLRFAIILDNKEIGYINVPLKNADWTPGRWHKIGAATPEAVLTPSGLMTGMQEASFHSPGESVPSTVIPFPVGTGTSGFLSFAFGSGMNFS